MIYFNRIDNIVKRACLISQTWRTFASRSAGKQPTKRGDCIVDLCLGEKKNDLIVKICFRRSCTAVCVLHMFLFGGVHIDLSTRLAIRKKLLLSFQMR